MSTKNIALIGFPGDYFYGFYQGLKEAGFEVYWVSTTKSMHNGLLKNQKIEAKYLLNPLEGFSEKNSAEISIETLRIELAKYESDGLPLMNDIILMDRILRNKSSDTALRFLYHVIQQMESFFKVNNITLINSGRDSSIQLASMVLGKKMGIPWVVPTRMRIPRDMYGFCTTHESDHFINFNNPETANIEWASSFLNEYRTGNFKPQLKIAATSFLDVFKILPIHLKVLLRRFREYFDDRGNDYTRYTILNLIVMYLKRRRNMILVKLARPFQSPGTNPFALYNLHTQPESSIDVMASFFSDQINLIKSIVRSLPCSHELYVKVHPTDVDGKTIDFFRQILAIPSVRLIHYGYDTKELLHKASIVFSLTGTVSIEAGLRGIPVVTLAKNFFNPLPTLYYCSDIKQLPELVKRILSQSPDSNIDAKIIEFLAKMKASSFEGEINRMYGSDPGDLTRKDIEMLKVAYNQLYNHLVLSN